MKRYLWCFPGMGKSSLKIEGLSVADADCELFKYRDVAPEELHGGSGEKSYVRDETYPENYLSYIRSVVSDVMLLNCHVGLLEQFDREDVLLVYPDMALVPEYLQRYQSRGDHPSFVSYMAAEGVGMIQFFDASSFEKYKVCEPNVYLGDLFERNDFKIKLMTRKDLAAQIKRAKDLDVLGFDNEKQALVCDAMFVGDNSIYNAASSLSAEALAEDVLDGKYSLDIEQLERVCMAREAELKRQREQLITHFQRAIELNVLDTDKVHNAIVCDLSFVEDGVASTDVHDAYDLADAVMNGKYEVDIDHLLAVCKQREEQLKEMRLSEYRGGLSREDLSDKLMQGIVNGALLIRYGQIAPYTHGYAVTFGGNGIPGSTYKFKNRWECYNCDFFGVPAKIVSMIEAGRQDGEVFGKDAEALDIREVLQAIDEMEAKKITSFTPEKETNFERWGTRYPGSRGSIASTQDVHAGKGLDGIVQHHYHGDYSSMTPARQNDLVETLVFMKGFCLDCLGNLSGGRDAQQKVMNYLAKHGIDVSTPERLQAWTQQNPEKCGLQKNRALAEISGKRAGLEEQIREAEAKRKEDDQDLGVSDRNKER